MSASSPSLYLRRWAVAGLLLGGVPSAQAAPLAESSSQTSAATTSAAPASAAKSDLDPAKREQLRGLVRQASERMQAGDKASAVALLEQARSLRADASLDYNLGIAYAELGRHPQAALAFERFLPAADPTRFLPERIDDVRRRLAEYHKSLSRLRARFTVPTASPATLYLDDHVLSSLDGGRLSEPQWLSPGSYRVRVAGPGLRDYTVSVELRPGEVRELTGEVLAEGSESSFLADAQAKAQKQEPLPFYRKPWFWAVIGGGAAVGIGFIAAGAGGAFDHTAPGSDLDPIDLFRK